MHGRPAPRTVTTKAASSAEKPKRKKDEAKAEAKEKENGKDSGYEGAGEGALGPTQPTESSDTVERQGEGSNDERREVIQSYEANGTPEAGEEGGGKGLGEHMEQGQLPQTTESSPQQEQTPSRSHRKRQKVR